MKSGYKDYLDQYTNLVNQPTGSDHLGDAYTKAGSQPAHGASQRSTNALLLGVGAGFKGGAAQDRQKELSPFLKLTGQITAKAAEIEAQTQKATQSKFQLTQFFQQTAVPIAQLSKASLANDIPASNELGRGVYMRFKQSLGDASMGDYDHYHNGTIYYHNLETGVVEGRNIVGLMYQAGINPMEIWGQDAPAIEAGLSPGAKQNYEDSQKIRQMEMERMRLGNEHTQAHTDVYKADASKTKHEMNNPEEPYNKEVANHNLAHIKEQRERKINAESMVATLNDLEGMIKEANKKGQAGSTLTATGRRLWGKYLSGDNEAATLADMAKAAYFARVKEGGGSNPSTTEFLTVLETVPNVDKNPQAALKRLQFDREQALKVMYRYKKTEEGLRKTKYQGSPDDEGVFKHNDDEYKTFSNQYYKPKIKVQAPDGTIALVSPEYADDLVTNKGGKVIDE